MIKQYHCNFYFQDKLIYSLSDEPVNAFFWNKRKAEIIEHLVKNRFFRLESIRVDDLGEIKGEVSDDKPVHPSKLARAQASKYRESHKDIELDEETKEEIRRTNKELHDKMSAQKSGHKS